MSIRINPEDCHAIDLVLDQGTRAAPGQPGRSVTTSAASISQDHLAAVQRVLGLLDLLTAPQPPADLVKRTLARIEAAPLLAHGSAEMPGMHIHRGQPLA
jgi:hypothetical protein